MANEPILVGIDVGTTSVKALAISPGGEIVGRAEEHYPVSSPRSGWSEQNPDDWRQAAERALRRVGDGEVLGIGLSGQMHGLVLLDAERRVLRPAILWNDQRTAAECAEIEERVGLERLIALTGNRALTGFTAPKLLWLRRHEPELFERGRHVLLPKDYVRLGLTGELATDVTDASGTLLFDVAKRRWSDEVVDALELDRAWLSGALESPLPTGRTRDGIPVAAGAGDQPAAAVGVGIDAPGPVSVVLGTSGVVLSVLPEFAADAEARVHAFCHAVPGTWQAMGVMLSAAASLRWFRDAFAPGVPYEKLLAEAEAVEAGADGLLFLPYLSGERTPHADPDARAMFGGLTLGHGRGSLVRAVLEGVAYGLRDSLELLRELGVRPETARLSGGGARSGVWHRIVASVLGLPVEVPEAQEGSALGAAILGGVVGGVFGDVHEGVAACVRPGTCLEPQAAWSEVYEAGYARYRALYPALKSAER